jgi:FHA domain
MIRCQEGHFYDPAKHSSCPWCAKPLDIDMGAAAPAPAAEIGAQKTTPVRPDDPGRSGPGMGGSTEPLTWGPGAPAAAPAPAGGATKRLIREQLGMDPVVGWLVCLDGPDRGRDYRLHSEKNFIGRAPTMDICISGDEAISREKHATITFEPKKQVFWLIPGDASGLVYLNGDVVYTPAQLKDRDVVELGKTKLVLVPFVNENFRWQE